MDEPSEYRAMLEGYLAGASLLKSMRNLGILSKTEAKAAEKRLAEAYGIKESSVYRNTA